MDLGTTRTVIMGLGESVALITYITNSINDYRNKNIENIDRFLKTQDEFFKDDGYIISNIKEMEAGTFKRH